MAPSFSRAQLLLVFLVVLVSFYINRSPPALSESQQRWREVGKYYNYHGYAVFYRDGKGKAKDQSSTVLCIHGFPTSSYDWSKIWPSLEENFGRIVAPDMLGLGFSDKPTDYNYTVKDQADIHEKLLDSLGIRKVYIIAHDLGDTVAQEMLARHEERRKSQNEDGLSLTIQSLCLSNGGIFPETNFPRITQKALVLPWIGSVLARLISYPFFSRRFSAVFGSSTQPSVEEMEDFWATVVHKNGHYVLPLILDYMRQRRVHNERWVGVLQTSTVPIHLIYGTADPVNPPEMLKKFRELVPQASFSRHLDIGHYPQWEDPIGFVSSVLDFVKPKPQN